SLAVVRPPKRFGPPSNENRPEVWIGLECTLNRVGDRFSNQCVLNGHDRRFSDLEKFAELKAKRIRYPFLWERAALSEGEYDWSFFDERAARLKELRLHPIAGLLHHGSGPRWTHLLDPSFPRRFADYARAFAERYPWIEDYTPINEPLTTARFSGLYGVWYPHLRSDADFVKALSAQIEGIRLAMLEIRQVNPRARLIQTEDLGFATSTPSLGYQALFENERRWLSFDLLGGRVGEWHPLYTYLQRAGLSERQMESFRNDPCPPDIYGINHYLLSNRFLDHRLHLYPACFHGGNGIDRYADVGAIDAEAAESPSPELIFRQVWERYRSPFAVTEVHLAGPREAQMRWLHEIWTTASRLRREGLPLKAVTAWSLLGSFDWNSLCVSENGHYEAGVFDVRASRPRRTSLGRMVTAYAETGTFDHPVLDEPGWWKKNGPSRSSFFRPLLITGGRGTLGTAFAKICARRNIPFHLVGRGEMDIADPSAVADMIGPLKPWAVINAAGFVRIEEAEVNRELCLRENVQGPEVLARACADERIPLLTFSSDLVFAGDRRHPYVESDLVLPLNMYGKSKAEAEEKTISVYPDALIVRTSSFSALGIGSIS
ncbi:MAG TPA: sugar nucleotide-binding protein, partial [Pseudobdellovibrionaceae bacterium]|nr:sugar nucleotide-binding protein [Pseudobdellovibrionaceae bacterium]